jgi:hypothetical protein
MSREVAPTITTFSSGPGCNPSNYGGGSNVNANKVSCMMYAFVTKKMK